MIQSLEIQNYQSHKNTFIEFSKGLNIITGASDVGKSAIIRAILWVLTNKPLGDDVVNWDSEGGVHVGIEFDDGYIIKERNSGRNTYQLESGNLEAVRSDVPDEVLEISRISDYNIQTQHQSYFLLQDSPGEVARKLNQLVGLDVIDRIYKNLASKISEAKSGIKLSGKRISNLEEQIEKLSYLRSVSIIIKKLIDDTNNLEIVQNNREIIRNLLKQTEENNSKIDFQKKILKIEPKVKELRAKIKDYNEQNTQIEKLITITQLYGINETKIKSQKKWILIEPKVKELKSKMDAFRNLINQKENLEKLLIAIELTQKSIETSKNKLSETQNQYIKLLEKHKICPTCKQPITFTVLKSIKENLQWP